MQAVSAARQFLGRDSVKQWLFYGGLPILAFIVLSPGMLMTIPPAKDCDGKAKFWASGQTSFGAVVMHALVFIGVLVATWKLGAALRLPVPY